MRFWPIVLFSLVMSRAFAASEVDLGAIWREGSSSRLSKKIAREKKDAKRSEICDAQLRTSKIPRSCFEMIGAKDSRFDWMKDLCVSRAKASNDRTELAKASTETRLPKDCRTAASVRLADLRYTDASDRPADLFRQDLGTSLE